MTSTPTPCRVTAGGPPARHTPPAGVRVLAEASWSSDSDGEPAAPPGFVGSSFSPMAAAVADRCLLRHHGGEPDPGPRTRATALILASGLGDLASAVRVARAVDGGDRISPLDFFQAVPTAVLGHIAARWGLAGPVTCISPVEDAVAEASAVAELLFTEGSATEALVVVVEQATGAGGHEHACALLVGPDVPTGKRQHPERTPT